jgi:hypothetical protein
MNTILDNAVASIQVGVDDYRSADPRRTLSAMRNISAGMLLLFKEKLRRSSPLDSNESLVKLKIEPKMDTAGGVTFRGRGKKTVGVYEIKDRFRSLGISVDWKRIEEVIATRNDIEHYRSDVPPKRMMELLSSCFIVIRDFITEELEDDPERLLQNPTWSTLLEVAEVYERERAACTFAIASVQWDSIGRKKVSEFLRCGHCSSDLIRPVDIKADDLASLSFHCSACGQDSIFDDILDEAVSDCWSADWYLVMTDGNDEPLTDCHECNRSTFLVEEGRCIACLSSLHHYECAICGHPLTSDQQDFGGLCSYHYEVAVKDE